VLARWKVKIPVLALAFPETAALPARRADVAWQPQQTATARQSVSVSRISRQAPVRLVELSRPCEWVFSSDRVLSAA
jgi:hypothetical protein